MIWVRVAGRRMRRVLCGRGGAGAVPTVTAPVCPSRPEPPLGTSPLLRNSRDRYGRPSGAPRRWIVVPMVMARRRRTAARRAPRQYSRTDRLGELVREVVASELERIGDERLELVTITDATVDGSLEHADVFWSALQAEDDGRLDEVVQALEEQRWKVQQVVNREVRARKTPQISFRHDDVLRSALRVDQILRDIEPGATGAPEPDGGSDGEPDGEPDGDPDDGS